MSREWYISDDDGIEAAVRDCNDTDEACSAVCYCTPRDAELIVNAVNCHNELLEALQAVALYFEGEDPKRYPIVGIVNAAIEKATKPIAAIDTSSSQS